MLTVPEAAARTNRNPETIRRWIRSGRLPSKKVGNQHVIDERDLAALQGRSAPDVPESWRTTFAGTPMPDIVEAVRRSRLGH